MTKYSKTFPKVRSVLPVDLAIFVEVLKTLKDLFQHRSYTGFIQHTGLVFPL